MENQNFGVPAAKMPQATIAQTQLEHTIELSKPIKTTIIMSTTAYFMSGIRDFTLSLAREMKISDTWAYRLQSIVDELSNNATEFGSAKEDEITITYSYTPGSHLDIIVEDSGRGTHPMTAAEIKAIVDQRKEPGFQFTGIRGRGLAMIVSGWSDALSFEDRPEGGIRATARMNLARMQEDMRQPGQTVPQTRTNAQPNMNKITLTI